MWQPCELLYLLLTELTSASEVTTLRRYTNVFIIIIASSREMVVLVYTAIFEKNMRNSTVNYLIPDWLTAVT